MRIGRRFNFIPETKPKSILIGLDQEILENIWLKRIEEEIQIHFQKNPKEENISKEKIHLPEPNSANVSFLEFIEHHRGTPNKRIFMNTELSFIWIIPK